LTPENREAEPGRAAAVLVEARRSAPLVVHHRHHRDREPVEDVPAGVGEQRVGEVVGIALRAGGDDAADEVDERVAGRGIVLELRHQRLRLLEPLVGVSGVEGALEVLEPGDHVIVLRRAPRTRGTARDQRALRPLLRGPQHAEDQDPPVAGAGRGVRAVEHVAEPPGELAVPAARLVHVVVPAMDEDEHVGGIAARGRVEQLVEAVALGDRGVLAELQLGIRESALGLHLSTSGLRLTGSLA
jgi:hypothetical protein